MTDLSGTYQVRECRNHYHVCTEMFDPIAEEPYMSDVVGGKFKNREDAEEAARRLNDGEDYEEVFGGTVWDQIEEEVPFLGDET